MLIADTVAAGASAQGARKWWMGELARLANEAGNPLPDLGVTPEDVVTVARLMDQGTLNDKLARQVFAGIVEGEGTPEDVIVKRGLALVSDDSALLAAIDAAIADNPGVVEKVNAGKTQAAGALIGAVMKATRGQADAQKVRSLLMERLGVR